MNEELCGSCINAVECACGDEPEDGCLVEGSHCDDIEAVLAALMLLQNFAGQMTHTEHLEMIRGRDAVTRLERHLDASAKEMQDLAEALSRAGGSGETCPVCGGSQECPTITPRKELDNGYIAGSVDFTNMVRCPRCSVPAGELVECQECGGAGLSTTTSSWW